MAGSNKLFQGTSLLSDYPDAPDLRSKFASAEDAPLSDAPLVMTGIKNGAPVFTSASNSPVTRQKREAPASESSSGFGRVGEVLGSTLDGQRALTGVVLMGRESPLWEKAGGLLNKANIGATLLGNLADGASEIRHGADPARTVVTKAGKSAAQVVVPWAAGELGAAIGTAVAPGPGTAIGGLLGFGAGLADYYFPYSDKFGNAAWDSLNEDGKRIQQDPMYYNNPYR
jgi:hypothetical protein